MAIEAQPGFEAQRVARAERDRRDLGLGEQPLGDRDGIAGRERNLEPVLAGIAGAGDEGRNAAKREIGRAHERHMVDAGDKARQDGGRRGALQRQQCAVEARLDRHRAIEMRCEMGEIDLFARRVDDEHQPIIDAGRHQIVEDAAAIVQQQRVTHTARRQGSHIAGNQRFQRVRRSGAVQPDLPHMGDVEQPGLRAGMEVFGDDAGRILHRHLVTREPDHAGTARTVQLIERRVLQRCCIGRIRHGRTSSRADANRVREMPPLSWTLRDSPRPIRK